MRPTHAAMRLISSQPDKEQLAEALGLLSYWGKDSASATITGSRQARMARGGRRPPSPTHPRHRPGTRRPVAPPADPARALGGEKIA